MGMRRTLFEIRQGFCDYCKKSFKFRKSRPYMVRNLIGTLVVCNSCKVYYSRYNTLERRIRIKLSKEERQIRVCIARKRRIIRDNEVLRSLSPEEHLKRTMEYFREMDNG